MVTQPRSFVARPGNRDRLLALLRPAHGDFGPFTMVALVLNSMLPWIETWFHSIDRAAIWHRRARSPRPAHFARLKPEWVNAGRFAGHDWGRGPRPHSSGFYHCSAEMPAAATKSVGVWQSRNRARPARQRAGTRRRGRV